MKASTKEIALFGMLAGLMFASKKIMESLPNIHLIGVMLTAITVVFRVKALYPLYAYILLDGVFGGFGVWWIPYLYIWTILWGIVMLLPKSVPEKWQPILYGGVCGVYGLLFGSLYAPAQALLYGFSFRKMLAWIAAGFPYDCIHGASNLILGVLLIVPLIRGMRRVQPHLN